MDVIANSVVCCRTAGRGQGESPTGEERAKANKGRCDQGPGPRCPRKPVGLTPSCWALGKLCSQLLAAPIMFEAGWPSSSADGSRNSRRLPGAHSVPAHDFPALAACPGGPLARLLETSSAGRREGQGQPSGDPGNPPSRGPDPEGCQLRAGSR